MKWHKFVTMGALGFSIGGFTGGVWRCDARDLSISFIFLGIAWLYREMNLGWNYEKNRFNFLPFKKKARGED